MGDDFPWTRPYRQENPRDIHLGSGVGQRQWAELILPKYPYPYVRRARLAKLDYFIYALRDNDDHGTGVMTSDYLLVVRDSSAYMVRKIVFGYAPVVPLPRVLHTLRNVEIPKAGPHTGQLPVSGANDVLVALRDYEITEDEREAIELYLTAMANLEKQRHTRIPANTLVELLIREWHRGDMGLRVLAEERVPSHPSSRPTRAPKTRESLESLRAALR